MADSNDGGGAGVDAALSDGLDGSGDEGAGGSGAGAWRHNAGASRALICGVPLLATRAGRPQADTSTAAPKRKRAANRTDKDDDDLVEAMRLEFVAGSSLKDGLQNAAVTLGRAADTVRSHWYRMGVRKKYEERYGNAPPAPALPPPAPPLPAPPPVADLAPSEAEMPDAQPAVAAAHTAAPAPAVQQLAHANVPLPPAAACESPLGTRAVSVPLASPLSAGALPGASESEAGAVPSQPNGQGDADAGDGAGPAAAEGPGAGAAPTQESMTAEVLRKLLSANATQVESALPRTELHKHLLHVFYGNTTTSALPKKDMDMCNNIVLHKLTKAGLISDRGRRPPMIHLTPPGVVDARAAAASAPDADAQSKEAELLAAAHAADALFGKNKRAADVARDLAAAAIQHEKSVRSEVEQYLKQHNRALYDARDAAVTGRELRVNEAEATEAQGAARLCVKALTDEVTAAQPGRASAGGQSQWAQLPPKPLAGIYRIASLNVGGCYFGGNAGAKLANGVALLARCAPYVMVLTEVAPDAHEQLQQLCRFALPLGTDSEPRWRAVLSLPHAKRECVAFLWDTSKLRSDGVVQALEEVPAIWGDVDVVRSRPPAYCTFSATSADNQLDFTLFGCGLWRIALVHAIISCAALAP